MRLDPMPTLPLSGTVAYSISAQRTRATATPTDRTFTATVDMASGTVTRQ